MNHTESRIEDEVRFWLRLSSDELAAADELPRTRILLALTDAIKRLVGHRQSSTH